MTIFNIFVVGKEEQRFDSLWGQNAEPHPAPPKKGGGLGAKVKITFLLLTKKNPLDESFHVS